MVNITLSVDANLYERMKARSEYKWSEVARQAIEQKLEDAQLIDDLKSIKKAKAEHNQSKTISFKQAIKRLGLDENDI
jgi:hypothetical protein